MMIEVDLPLPAVAWSNSFHRVLCGEVDGGLRQATSEHLEPAGLVA